jgi:hypothetical protein
MQINEFLEKMISDRKDAQVGVCNLTPGELTENHGTT